MITEDDKKHIANLPIVAKQSHDPDTQTASILVRKYWSGTGEIVRAANEIPLGVLHKQDRLVRPEKYSWIMHAERNAIAIAANDGIRTEGTTLYLNWFPCSDCAQMIVQAGVTRLVAHGPSYEARKDDPRYGFATAMSMLLEKGVEIDWYDENN